MIEDLPDVLVSFLLSFCWYKDTLKVATLSLHFRDHVEAFYANKLESMRERADSSWNYRLGMQVNLPQGRAHPPTLSNRHMFKIALKTNLYSLQSPESNNGSISLLCLPDGNTLVSHGRDKIVHVWDVETKSLIRSFGEGIHRPLPFLTIKNVSGDFILAHTNDRSSPIHVWTMEGNIEYDIATNGQVEAIAASNSRVFFTELHDDGSRTIVAAFVASRERILETSLQWGGQYRYAIKGMVLMGNYLVVGCEEEGLDSASTGIHAFSTSDLTHQSFYPLEFEGEITVANDGSRIVTINTDGEVTVLSMGMDDGRLVRESRFDIHQFEGGMYAPDAAPVLLGSNLYVVVDAWNEHEGRWIAKFDIRDGSLMQTLNLSLHDTFTNAPLYPSALVSNGHDIFCGFSIGTRGPHSSINTIKAYPA